MDHGVVEDLPVGELKPCQRGKHPQGQAAQQQRQHEDDAADHPVEARPLYLPKHKPVRRQEAESQHKEERQRRALPEIILERLPEGPEDGGRFLPLNAHAHRHDSGGSGPGGDARNGKEQEHKAQLHKVRHRINELGKLAVGVEYLHGDASFSRFDSMIVSKQTAIFFP